MSLPRYPEYKDSGVAWLGVVPGHWDVLALSRVLAAPITDGPHTTPVFIDDGIPFLSVDGIQDGELVFDGCRHISADNHYEFSKKAKPSRNDILMGKAASIGKIARVKTDMEFSIWSPLALIRPNVTACIPTFLEYTLKSKWLQAQIEALANSNTQLNIGMKDIPKLRLSLPPITEQTAIATFLDRETAKIDGLIAEQEKLITLLAEKRQATISHAVTKGLNPDVPMKNSGAVWVGIVPAHWDVRRVKDVSRLESGHTPSKQFPEYWENCEIPWVSLNDSKYLAANDYISDTAVKINELGLANSSARVLPSATVVFTRDATIGLAAITTRPMAVSQHLIAWCPTGQMESKYLLRVFNAMKNHLDSYTFGATIKTIGMGDVKTLVTPVPPIAEQVEIVRFIDIETARLETLTTEATRGIALLKERRSALISAAVTGKIDVRHLAEAEAA